ncbi:MAG: hypothetical protein ACP5MU_05900 [Thermoplasmata archaeon]
MTTVVVIHTWKDDQANQVMDFAKKVTDMAKAKKLPQGLELQTIDLAKGKNHAVCVWNVDSLDHLMQVAGSLGPTWEINAFEVNNFYTKKKGFF